MGNVTMTLRPYTAHKRSLLRPSADGVCGEDGVFAISSNEDSVNNAKVGGARW